MSPSGAAADRAPTSRASDAAIDRERLVWDPEYRREIARLLRQSPVPRS